MIASLILSLLVILILAALSQLNVLIEPNVMSCPPVAMPLAATDYVMWAVSNNRAAQVVYAEIYNPTAGVATITVTDGAAGIAVDIVVVNAGATQRLNEQDTKGWKFGIDVVFNSDIALGANAFGRVDVYEIGM